MRDNIIKIDSVDHMVRDVSNHAVILSDSKKIEEYKARRSTAEKMHDTVERQQVEIDKLSTDISEIKQMLTALLQR